MSPPPLEELLEFALALSRAAGEYILPLWKNVATEHKADGSEVTEADRGAELLLRQLIAERYPSHAILGEEFGGERNPTAEHLWLIDPVDGTASFALGLPLFGTLIGYVWRGQSCVGVIGAHALGETTFAATGQGCWRLKNGGVPERVSTSRVDRLKDAFVICTAPENTDMEPCEPKPSIALSQVYRKARRFRWSGDCINYALLCQGRIDVAIDPRMNPWDIAALAPCVREAGGVITACDGNEDVIWQPNLLASSSQSLHSEVLESLRLVPQKPESEGLREKTS